MPNLKSHFSKISTHSKQFSSDLGLQLPPNGLGANENGCMEEFPPHLIHHFVSPLFNRVVLVEETYYSCEMDHLNELFDVGVVDCQQDDHPDQ